MRILTWVSVAIPHSVSCLTKPSNFSRVSLFRMLFIRRVISSSFGPAGSRLPLAPPASSPRRRRCCAAQESSETANFSAFRSFEADPLSCAPFPAWELLPFFCF